MSATVTQEGWIQYNVEFANKQDAMVFRKKLPGLKDWFKDRWTEGIVETVSQDGIEEGDAYYIGVCIDLINKVWCEPGEKRTWDFPGSYPYAEGMLQPEEIEQEIEKWADEEELEYIRLEFDDTDICFDEAKLLEEVGYIGTGPF